MKRVDQMMHFPRTTNVISLSELHMYVVVTYGRLISSGLPYRLIVRVWLTLLYQSRL